MDKLVAIRIKHNDGTYSNDIPLSVLAVNIDWDGTHNLVDVLGSIDIDVAGTVQDQINKLFNEKVSNSQLQNYINNQLNTDIQKWLNTNIKPVGSAVMVDTSLTVTGAAADAKATRSAIEKAIAESISEFLITIDDSLTKINEAAQAAATGAKIQEVNNLKINKPVASPNGLEGQILKTNGDGTTEWIDKATPTMEEINNCISAWLDNHPQATTTVEDYSITKDKIAKHTLVYATPEEYGAFGDGEHDDTQALQTAITENNYIILTGIYKISNGILLHSNLVIKGYNNTRIIKDSQSSFTYANFYSYDVPISNVIIENCIFEGGNFWTNQTISGRNNDYGIRVDSADNFIIKQCIFKDFGACSISFIGENCFIAENNIIYTKDFNVQSGEPNYNFGIAYSGQKINIYKNFIKGTIQGILSGQTNKNVKIVENDIQTNGQHGFYLEHANNILIANNLVHNCTLVGIKIQRASDNLTFKDINIVNNNILSCGAQGILIADLSPSKIGIANVNIDNNIIKNCPRGVEVFCVESSKIADNLIVDDTYAKTSYGIYVHNANNLTIESNRIENTLTGYSSGGIAFAYTIADKENILIKNNYLINTSDIKFYSNILVHDIIIDGNIIVDSQSNGSIVFYYGEITNEVIICNNICSKNINIYNNISPVYKKCYNNLGVFYLQNFDFLSQSNYISINSQKNYIKNDIICINLNITVLSRSSSYLALMINIPNLNLEKNKTIIAYGFSYNNNTASVLKISIVYDSSNNLKLYILDGSGTVNSSYNINLCI